MAWSRANDRILTLGIGGLGVPHDGDLEALAYEAEMRKAGRGEIVDLMHLRLVHRNLARIRRAARITDEVMAGRLGISPYMVRLFDAKPAAVTLAAMQRYTRVLGGRMRPVLTNRHPRRRRRSPNPPPPTLAAANAARRTAAATRTVAQARQLLAARGFTLSAQDTLFLAARADRPEASLAELAAACGVTRDRYASRLRRLLAGHPA
jgi:transcriptional regulator with XRE-family HTH domain